MRRRVPLFSLLLVLALTLGGPSSLAPLAPRVAWADLDPTPTDPPPDAVGDPDYPQGPAKGPGTGATPRVGAPRPSAAMGWWFHVRMALSLFTRGLVRL